MSYKVNAFLQRLGLTKNEIKVYLAALEKEGATASAIAHHAGVHRVAAYALIDSLIEKGFLHVTEVQGRRHIYAVSPKNLSKIFQEKRRQLRKLELQFQDILPQLQLLHQRDPFQPRVSVFYGVEGIRMIQEDILNTMEKDEVVYSIVNVDGLLKIFPRYFEEGEYRARRIEKGFRNRAILPAYEVTQKLFREERYRNLTELRLVNPQKFPITINMTIYKGKVSMTSLSDPLIGIIIDSPEIARNLQIIYELAWLGAKTLKNGV